LYNQNALFMGIGELRGGKMGANGKMQYNPGWESGSMKTLAAHGLAGGIVSAPRLRIYHRQSPR
jgi:hypothetical protein